MKNVARVRWLSRFDMEPLLSSILITGLSIGVVLMAAGWIVGRVTHMDMDYGIRAISIPRLIQADLRRFSLPDFWPRLLIDLGYSFLLITPYVRLVATWSYLAFVKHRWRYAVYTGVLLVLFTLVLFSDIILSNLH